MKVLIVGGGGREHALAWKLAQSPLVKGIVASPGNPGIAQVAACVAAPKDVADYVGLAQAHEIDLTIVGPEAPLVAGIVDHFERERMTIVGPTQAAARLEGSKIFAKHFFEAAGIPTARSTQVSSYRDAADALKRFGLPVVVKADGLAAGKGVVIAQDRAEAEEAVQRLGPNLVVEEFLEGREVSFIGLSNGEQVFPLAPTQDHKRAYDGDKGPNTGGMGAYCDPGILSGAQVGEVMDRIMMPAIARMQKEGTPFRGFLYAGLMMTAEGPKVLEFNVRLGDPETQALMQAFHGDLAVLLTLLTTERIGVGSVSAGTWGESSVCVVAAAAGYPGEPRVGDVITGIRQAEALGTTVFQAGTRIEAGELRTSGGRVLGVTASGADLREAAAKAYRGMEEIRFAGMQFRRDIGAQGSRAGDGTAG